MSQGSKWQIVIPPELGYGEQGAGGRIGPNETMVFDIELVGIGTGGTQTAAAREAERTAREREAGSGPTSQPSVDWKNRQYTLDCDMSPPIKVDVRNGHAERPPDNDYSQNGYMADVKAVIRPQDLTGDGKPETAVLLYCSPQPSNFWRQEVQVFTDGSKLLAKLRSLDPLPTNPLSPMFDPSEFTIRDGKLVTGVRYHAATDSHASGPSIHRVLTWRWKGQGFETDATVPRPSPATTDPAIAGCAVINDRDYSANVTLVARRQNHLNRGQEREGLRLFKGWKSNVSRTVDSA